MRAIDEPEARSAGAAGEPAAEALETRPHADESHRKVLGVSLSWKVTLPVLAVAAVTMFGIRAATLGEARAALEEEFDAYGVHLAKALAAPSIDSWSSTATTVVETAERVVGLMDEFDDYLGYRHGIVVEPPELRLLGKNGLTPEFQAEQARAIAEFEAAQAANRGKLASLLRRGVTGAAASDAAEPSDIVDAFIRDETARTYLVRARETDEPFTGAGPLRDDVVGGSGIQIGDGTIGGVDVRAFTHAIDDPAHADRYRAYVFLRTDGIARALEPLAAKTLQLSLVFVLAAGLITYVVTRLATAPLRALARDADIVAAGDLHHRTKVRTDDEIGMLARTLDSVVRRVDYALAEHDEQVSGELHQKMIADAIPYVHGFRVDVVRIAAQGVGGVGYDFLELPERRVGFVVTEAPDSGVPAALNVVMVEALLRNEGRKSADPVELLAGVSDTVGRSLHADAKVTTLVASLDPRSREMALAGTGLSAWVGAGPSPGFESIKTGDGVLGRANAAGLRAALRARTLTLAAGDRVVLTNRLAEHLTNERGEALGEERLERILEQAAQVEPKEFAAVLRHRLAAFRGKAALRQDVVAVVLQAE